ncbi:MAG: glycosyltransferase family 4 protein [bacterium]|nr:glycosyltransferase family 4 protein [bacterium]
MKICIMTTVHEPFDVRIFHKEAKTLVNAGHEVVLIAPSEVKEQVRDEIRIIGLPRYKRRLFRPLNWINILWIGLQQKADAYHFHDIELLPIGILIKMLLRKCVVYDVHEHIELKVLNKEWIPKILRRPISSFIKWFEPFLAQYMSAIVIVMENQRRKFAHIGCPIVTLYNFPKKDLFSSIHSKKGDSQNIIFVGGLSVTRGALILGEIMNWVVKKHPDASLLIAGKFDTLDTEKRMLECFKKYHIEDHLKFLGYIPHDELKRYLNQARVGIFPLQPTSEYPMECQCLPTKLFEYMACEIPIVGSKMPALEEVMRDLNCGILVEPTDPKKHAEAIIYLLDNPRVAKQMGENGRRAFLERCNWEAISDRLVNLYREVLRC